MRRAEMSAPHRLAYDSRGYYCLNCDWPGAGFTADPRIARAHVDDSVEIIWQPWWERAWARLRRTVTR